MSLLRRHTLLGSKRKRPSVVQTKSAQPAATTSYAITPNSTPSDGNLMVVMFGGLQSRTVNSNPSGWTNLVSLPGGVTEIWYKFASGESGSYTWTWSGGTLQGGYAFVEIKDATVSLLSSEFISPGTTISSISFASRNILQNSIGLGMCIGNSNTWTFDSGYTPIISNTLFSAAYKIYGPELVFSEVVTVSGVSTTTKRADLIRYSGRIGI